MPPDACIHSNVHPSVVCSHDIYCHRSIISSTYTYQKSTYLILVEIWRKFRQNSAKPPTHFLNRRGGSEGGGLPPHPSKWASHPFCQKFGWLSAKIQPEFPTKFPPNLFDTYRLPIVVELLITFGHIIFSTGCFCCIRVKKKLHPHIGHKSHPFRPSTNSAWKWGSRNGGKIGGQF